MSGANQNRQSKCPQREMPFGSEFVVETDMVEKVIQSLRGNKAPGSDSICEKHLMYAPGCVIVHISTLLTCMLIHGYLPNSMTDGIIVPIVKDELASRSEMSNYRSVTLSSTISKILELELADMCKSNLQSSNLQFGFKQKHSTTMCSFLVRETIEYFNTKGFPVFSCFMDASKGFDWISHDKLFGILEERGLNTLILRLLKYWYKI